MSDAKARAERDERRLVDAAPWMYEAILEWLIADDCEDEKGYRRALEKARRAMQIAAPQKEIGGVPLVCDRGCSGVRRVARESVDITTSGHTDVICACGAPMVVLP